MGKSPTSFDAATALLQLDSVAGEGRLSEGAVSNIRAWLTEPRYVKYAPLVAEHLAEGRWKELDDVFWTIIPFGTGGRRGRMYPIGSNAINDRTIGESAQGLADYVKQVHGGNATSPNGSPLGCAIAYDTRHQSRHFAELCAEVMVAAGFKVFFLDGFRSTPECSFLVRYKQCACGIMVTASHNPPCDNAVKVYWSTGGQLLPPHDRGVIERVLSTTTINRTLFSEGIASGQIDLCQDDVDAAYIAAVLKQSHPGPRDLQVIYSPLHGVGAISVLPVLERDGFKDVKLFGPHAEPNGDFPNVPGHVSNPENPAVFGPLIAQGQQTGADLAIATDPDSDRIGLAAPLTLQSDGAWGTLTGNQIGALLADFVLGRWQAAGRLTRDHYIISTLVTTHLTRSIGESYGVRVYDNLHVGFKTIVEVIDKVGPDKFVYATEESHGYLAGTHCRDKDGVVAAMLAAELAAQQKAEGRSLHEKLDDLFRRYGYYGEKTVNVIMPGSEGMGRMAALMARIRKDPPRALAGMQVAHIRDYKPLTQYDVGGPVQPLDAPPADMVMMDLDTEGCYVAVRPSGTEPKVKFYMFTYQRAEDVGDLESTKANQTARLDAMARDLAAYSEMGG